MTWKNRAVGALLGALVGASPALAGDFAVLPAYWDTDAAGQTAGGGIALGLPFNPTVGIEMRATYFEELGDDPLAAAFDSDDTVFQDRGINVAPLELGLRVHLTQSDVFQPYLSGGGSYFLLDSDFGEVDDELGYYAALGANIGDREGASFFIEGIWRKATAQVRLDPEELDQIDDLDVEDRADIDLDGVGANLGVRWRF